MVDLVKLEELAKAAEPGPWGLGITGEDARMVLGNNGKGRYVCNVQVYQTPRHMGQWDEKNRIANAAFIAAANPATILELLAEIERLREALTPSGGTKAAYMGEFSFRISMVNCEDDEEYMQPVNVPWTTIKKIMKAISARAALIREQEE